MKTHAAAPKKISGYAPVNGLIVKNTSNQVKHRVGAREERLAARLVLPESENEDTPRQGERFRVARRPDEHTTP